jgi:hypothetical protein
MTRRNSGRGVYGRVVRRSAEQPMLAGSQKAPTKALNAA